MNVDYVLWAADLRNGQFVRLGRLIIDERSALTQQTRDVVTMLGSCWIYALTLGQHKPNIEPASRVFWSAFAHVCLCGIRVPSVD